MRTRTSWRNQNRLWKELGNELKKHPATLSEKELTEYGYALVTASVGDEMNWKEVARRLLAHIRAAT